MIVDKELPIGIIANTAAVLGLSLGAGINGLIGAEVEDKDNFMHTGITNIPIPVLALNKEEIKEIYNKLIRENDKEITIIGFNTVAQKSRDYEDYIEKMKYTSIDELKYLGICLYGPKKIINKISGSIGTLK
jgi:hypothetical protein